MRSGCETCETHLHAHAFPLCASKARFRVSALAMETPDVAAALAPAAASPPADASTILASLEGELPMDAANCWKLITCRVALHAVGPVLASL